MARKHRPKGYWNDFANLQAEILRFVEEHGTDGQMPTSGQLRAAGWPNLNSAIQRHGGTPAVAARLGLEPTRKPAGYWQDFEHTAQEVLAFVEQHGTPGVMPTQAAFSAAGRTDLQNAVMRSGGQLAVAERLGLRIAGPRRPYRYWAAPGRLEQDLLAYVAEHGTPGVMPTLRTLLRDGRDDLTYAIQRDGGLVAVADRLGLRRQSVEKG